MNKRDLGFLVSLLLLLSAAVTASAGLLSEALDLNEFVYHKYAGFLTAGLAIVHVYLRWPRLLAYFRGRRAVLQPAGKVRMSSPAPGGGPLSRRGLLGLALGAVGGFLLGRVTGLEKATPLARGADIGEAYHQWSKPGLQDILGTVLHWGRQPAQYKEYARAQVIPLPPARGSRGLSLEEAIERRRSVRDYSGEPMTVEELSRLLYYTCGINEERWGQGLRAAPSAGALYPIEVYPVVHHVADLAPGLYHYSYPNHALERLKEGDYRLSMVRHGVGQEFLGWANVVLVLAAIFQRTRWKYQERTYRYVLLEAGHIGQNAYLAATSMGLGACAVGAFFDDDLNRLLEVDGTQEAVVYLLAVGKKA
ncbi:MAG: SagB/ThcOx family dehydrogenase [Chloroflexota bacterium]